MSELIFITGASGYLGAHIVIQLLNKGYRVRAAARGAKVAELQKLYASFGNKFDVAPVSDLSTDQITDALEGVDAVIHTAAPIAERQSRENILKGAINGTLNVIRQAEKAGIKRIVVTSSVVTALKSQTLLTDEDWNPVTEEKALSGSSLQTYVAAKTLAEREVWAFADSHPDIDITVLNPPILYGPFAEGFTVPTGNYYALSTALWVYRLMAPAGTFPGIPGYADVRDIATIHVLALTSPPTAEVGRKRILLSSPFGFQYKGLLELIAEKRPELKDRLTGVPAPVFSSDRLAVDFERIERVLGFKQDQFRNVEESILEMVDNLMRIEKEWIADGHKISIPNA